MGLFDWFENKKAQFWRDETARTLFDADQRFSTEKKLTVLLLFYRSHILNYGIIIIST